MIGRGLLIAGAVYALVRFGLRGLVFYAVVIVVAGGLVVAAHRARYRAGEPS